MGWAALGIVGVIVLWLLLRRRSGATPRPPVKVDRAGIPRSQSAPPAQRIPALTKSPGAPTNLRYSGGRLYWDPPAHRGQGPLKYFVVGAVVGDTFLGWGKPVHQWGGVEGDTTRTSQVVEYYRRGRAAVFAVVAQTPFGRAYSKPLRVG